MGGLCSVTLMILDLHPCCTFLAMNVFFYTPPNIWDILSLESPDSQTLEWGGLGTC